MADEKSAAQKRRDAQMDAAESAALSGKPPPKQPQEKPSGFFETARKALEGFGVKHNVNGKPQDKAP